MYIIAAAIGGRVSFNTADEYDAMDGELICRYVLEIPEIFLLLTTKQNLKEKLQIRKKDENSL